MRTLILCFVLGIWHAPSQAAANSCVTIRHHQESDEWLLDYHFVEPIDAFIATGQFIDPRFSELVSIAAMQGQSKIALGKVAYEGGELTVIKNADGSSFQNVSIKITPDYDLDEWYRPFLQFTNGSGIFLGYIDGYTLSIDSDEIQDLQPSALCFITKGDGVANMISVSGESKDRLTIPRSTDGASQRSYLYFGQGTLEPQGKLKVLMDPGIDAVTGAFLQSKAQALVAYFEAGLGSLQDLPDIWLQSVAEPQAWGARGDAIPGQLVVSVDPFDGQGAAPDNYFVTLAQTLSHEISHHWNALAVSGASDQDIWLWEGGAELLAWQALRDLAVIDAKQYKDQLLEQSTACFDDLGDRSLNQVIADGSSEWAAYRCGRLLQELAIQLVQTEVASFDGLALWRLIAAGARQRQGTYSTALFFELIEQQVPNHLDQKAALRQFLNAPGNVLRDRYPNRR